MIYRNSQLAKQIAWSPDMGLQAADVACDFLRSESELLPMARIAAATVSDLEEFLMAGARQSVVVKRSVTGELLVCALESKESLLITGKTAEVLWCYIDDAPVTFEDRVDMTLRRRAEL
jgi:hypothetical protein